MPEKYMAIAWSGLPVFQMMIPTLEGAIFFYLFWVLRVLWYSSLPERTDSIIWLRDEVMVCLCFCPITWKTIYNLVFPSLNLFSPHLPFVPEPWAFPKGTALCLLPVLKGTAQPLRAPCWVVWGGWLFPMSSQGSPCIPSRTVPQSPLLIWAEILSFIPLGLVFCCFLHRRHCTHSRCSCVCFPHLNLNLYL